MILWKIKYTNNINGSWDVQTLTDSELGTFGAGANPNIAIESNGKAHIFYRGDDGFREIHHAENNSYGGTQWHYEHITNFSWYTCYGLSNISKNGDIHLITNGSSDFQSRNVSYYFIRRSGSTKWSLPTSVTNSDGEVNSFILDINNKAHITWAETSKWFFTGNAYYANNKAGDWIFHQIPIDTLNSRRDIIRIRQEKPKMMMIFIN